MTQDSKHDPAWSIIKKLKGAARIHRILNIPISTVCAWAAGSAGKGFIPRKHWEGIKKIAREDGWELQTLHLTGELPVQ